MKTLFIIVISTIVLFSSCRNLNSKRAEENDNNIPEAFQEEDYIKDISSWKRGYSSVVEKLYNELLEKDEFLKQLEEEISKLNEDNYNDNIEINKFSANNRSYYDEITSYTETVKDSTLRNLLISKINFSEDDYRNNTSDMNELKGELNLKIDELNDFKIAMKIILTEKSIKEYQNNFKQDTSIVKSLIERYENLINEINQKIEE